MEINHVVTEIEAYLKTYDGVVECQVRPSGDDADVIKIWVDLGASAADPLVWAAACEAAIRKAIPSPYRLQLRAEAG